jgi:hypothetical protein
MKLLVRLFNIALFLAAWAASCVALHWLAMQWLETGSLLPDQPLPPSFEVVVETRAAGAAPSYDTRRFISQAELKLEPGESLQLSTPAYNQMDHETSGSCCLAFKVLEDGPAGQVVEVQDDDMSYVMSRYRVRDGQVTPLAHRLDYSLYYVGYGLLGAFVAWLLTRPIRRRLLAWAKARQANVDTWQTST